jgi:hypothetical protein
MSDLARVQSTATRLQGDYQSCATAAGDTLADISSARPALGKALVDSGVSLVAADGATVRKKVTDAVGRLRSNQSRLHTLIGQANNSHWQLPRSDQELQQLSLALAGQPAVAALLKQASELVQIGSSQHQGASRAAGWARNSAVSAESELTQCGNAMNAVAADSVGKSVAGEAAQVKFRVDQSNVHLLKQQEHLGETSQCQSNALLCLQDAQVRLAQALEQLPPEDKFVES